MLIGIKSIRKGLTEVVFPHTCLVCSSKLPDSENFVCRNCLQNKFEMANPDGKQFSADMILPEGVALQHALWKFDKGGYLQDLLHKLKYHRLAGVGEDIGRALGRSLINNPNFNKEEDMLLVPVPLHKRKKRIRGYNQAYYISKGIQSVLEIPRISQKALLRVKNTKTQTGFTLEKRRKNIEKAFLVKSPEVVEGKTCIIVDDVFTTGATTFELAAQLLAAGAFKIMITTVAQA